jgi:tetratricopeptide (TPR) repeat protein
MDPPRMTSASTNTLPDADTPPALSPEEARVLGQVRAGLFGAEATVTIDRFVLVRRLGAGGMGEVMLAYDPELDRKVAIKLVRSDLSAATVGTASDEGLLREARAAAKLQHPNVVSIYEIGRARDRLFIAMEYVAGRTVRAWLTEKPRSVVEILHAFEQAGRGLQAAHDAGLVHRDFKPDNLLVGDDDRVRVVDFGIAGLVDPTTTRIASDGSSTTRRIVGTPRYMAPEQFEGIAVDARADQFAFCVSLWEAISDTPPFGGSSAAEIAARVLDGRIEPAGPRMPGRIEKILARGLKPEPSDRWADMRTLLAALARARDVPRRNATIAGIVAALGVGGAIAWSIAPSKASCKEPDASALAGTAEERAQWIATIDMASHSAANGERAVAVLDAFDAQWRSAYDEACAATHDRAEYSTAVLDARMSCLERVRSRARTLTDLLAATDRNGAWKAIDALAELPLPSRCLQVASEATATPACVAEIDAHLDHAFGLRELGKLAEARTHAQDAEAIARDCGPVQLLAEARGLVARISADLDEPDADLHLRRAATAALTDQAPEAVARAAMRLAEIQGGDRGRGREASVWIEIAAASAAVTDDEALVTDVMAAEARVALQAGDVARASDLGTRVLDARKAQLGDDHPRIATALAQLAWVEQYEENWDAALALHEQAIAIRRRWYPPEHPILASSLNAMAVLLTQRGDRPGAIAKYREAIAMLERAYGPTHRDVGAPLINLADALAQTGQTTEALELIARAEAIAKADGNERILEAGEVIRAIAYAEAGRLEESEVAWRRVLELRIVRYGADDPATSMAHDSVCRVLVMREKYEEALTHCRRSVAIDSVAHGPNHPSVIGALELLAEAAMGAGNTAEARAALERAVAVAEANAVGRERLDELRAALPAASEDE